MRPNGLKIKKFKIGPIGPEPKKPNRTEPIRKEPFEFGSYWVQFSFGSFYKITDLNQFYLISNRIEPCPPLVKLHGEANSTVAKRHCFKLDVLVLKGHVISACIAYWLLISIRYQLVVVLITSLVMPVMSMWETFRQVW